jgi:hypothetical protein
MKTANDSPRKYVQQSVLLLLAAAILIPRLLPLDRFVTIDEHGWLTRALNFYRAIAKADLEGAYQARHPGVTTMAIGTAALFWEFPTSADAGSGEIGDTDYEEFLLESGHRPIDVLIKTRLLMTLANGAALMASFAYARRLLGLRTALLGFLLIALSPFQAAHTQIVHIDGLMSSLVLLALLSFLASVQSGRRLDLLVSAAAAGLSWLTKSPGIFLIPAVGVLGLGNLAKDLTVAQRAGWRQRGWQRIWTLLVWGLVAVLVFVALWPAMWVAPLESLSGVFGGALDHAEHGHPSPVFFNGQVYPHGQLGLAFYPISYVWRTTPVILAGLVLGTLSWIMRRDQLAKETRFSLRGLVIFAVLFLVQASLSGKKFDRYLLPVYAPLTIVAGHGWIIMTDCLTQRLQLLPGRTASIGLLAAVLALQGAGMVSSFPYYVSYFNPVLGGPERALNVLTIGWGEGLDRAARYLNEKPNAGDLRVVSWYEPCVSYFFKGTTLNIDNTQDISPEHLKSLFEADYLIIYIHQWQRDIPRSLMDVLAERVPEHTIEINGLPYVEIYDVGGESRGP